MLVLDEPTASLPQDEVARPVRACCARCKRSGVGMIYVSHRLDEVFEIADERGRAARRAAGRTPADAPTTTPESWSAMIVGRPPEQVFVRAERRRRPIAAADLRGLRIGDVGPVVLRRCTRGEMVGLVGPARRRPGEVGRALFGRRAAAMPAASR